MSKVLVIGCGGVAGVAISKCCQVSEVFTELCIASRTKSKCDALAAKLAPITKTKITTAQVDADDVQQLCDLIQSYKPDLVMNIALPYQDLTIMDACLACGVNYMDTANYEPENTDDPEWRAIYEKRCKEAGFSAYFDYSWQWAYKARVRYHRYHRYSGLQRRRSRLCVRDKLQSGDQSSRGFCARQLLGKRPLGRNPGYEH